MDFPTAPSGPPGNSNSANSTCINLPPPPQPPAFGDPSKRRRDLLKKHEQPPIILSNLCPIDKYYASADKVFVQFKAHLATQQLDDAYIIGRRFALFSTVSLPKHDYYKSPKPELVALRLKNQKDAQWVTRGLERIVEVMDKQEIEKQKVEEERLLKLKQEEEEKRVEWEKSMRQRLDAATGGEIDSKSDSALDMASKLEKLNAFYYAKDEDEVAIIPSAPPDVPSAPDLYDAQPLPPPVAPPIMGEQDMALLNSMSATQQLKSNGGTPLFAESTPPAYNDLFLESLRTSTPSSVSSSELADLERLPSASSVASAHKQQPRPKPEPRPSIRVLIRDYERHMHSLLQTKQIESIKLGTYQGRLSASNPKFDSTNGCAVISPLVVATHIYPQHLQRNRRNGSSVSITTSKYGISNSDINEIIDKRAPPILKTVRSKLGLNQHALIIPSDVHDYLVDEHILPQDKFVGVCGGDIMDKQHMNELINMLLHGKESGGSGSSTTKSKTCVKQKIGATLFFREHVISILKIPLGNGACYYDLVDSLPSFKTGGMASRTRCKDLASFEVLLHWYASSKFSDANCSFIDNNKWNDGMADFDARTFQAFVWSEG